MVLIEVEVAASDTGFLKGLNRGPQFISIGSSKELFNKIIKKLSEGRQILHSEKLAMARLTRSLRSARSGKVSTNESPALSD